MNQEILISGRMHQPTMGLGTRKTYLSSYEGLQVFGLWGGNSVYEMAAKAEICGKRVEISGMKTGFFTLIRAISAYFRVGTP